MTFLNPAGLLLLLSLPVIVLLHLFRQERRRREVSSLFLWREIADQQSRRMRPRFLRNINLILQLIAALIASLALAQPTLSEGLDSGAPRVIVLVDTSASMAAREGQVDRLDLAKNRARELIGRSRRDSEIMIATAGPLPAVVQSFTTDRTLLYDVIRTLETQDGPGNISGSIRMIRGLGNLRDTDVIFVTDAAFELDGSVLLPEQLRVERVGTAMENRAITEFRVRRRFDGSALEAYLELANFAGGDADLLLELRVDGATISRREVAMGAGESRRLAVDLPGVSGSVFEARLAGNEDALVTDDAAYGVASSVRPLRVQLVTAGNYFLESILSVIPDVSLTVTGLPNLETGADLFVFDGVEIPAGIRGSVLAIATTIPDGPYRATEVVRVERPPTVNRSHPVAANLDLSDVTIARATGGTLSGRALPVASAGDIPLIYTNVGGGLRLAGLTFSLADSDIGLRGSFPILMNNLIAWLAPSPQESGVGAVSAGATVGLLVTPGEPVTVSYPSGRETGYMIRDNTLVFRDTTEAGIYTVAGQGFVDYFAVTLTDAGESDLRPRLPILETGGASEQEAEGVPGRPLWQWFAALALLLFVADWVIWARRT